MKELIDSVLPFIPEKYRSVVATLVVASPMITRAIYALMNGKGIKGIFSSIWLGTNAPKDGQSSDGSSKVPLILLVASLSVCAVGCKAPHFESGGAYAGITSTNSVGDVLQVTEPEQALFVTDAAYRLAYDAIFAVCSFEAHNRDVVAKVSPSIKPAVDAVRTQLKEIDHRWALARQAYKAGATPAGLDTIKRIIAEVQRLVPVAQSQLAQ